MTEQRWIIFYYCPVFLGKCVGVNDNCLSSAQGTKCVLLNNGACVTPETAELRQRYKTVEKDQMSHPTCDSNPEGGWSWNFSIIY